MIEKDFFQKPFQIGSLQIKNRVILAPLAGVSDVPFRRIASELGAGLTYVEMLSAAAIKYKNKRTFEMMARHESESILGVQITGSNAQEVADGVAVLDKQGFSTIDINMGCPVRKVVGSGCGSAILKEPERVSETVKLAKSSTSKPLSAKIRLGFTRDQVNVQDTVTRLCTESVDMFTIHGRTRSEGYSTPCDKQGIHTGIESYKTNTNENKIVTVGNGDVFCATSARQMITETGCDAVMVSRGALGNPWVFKQILEQNHNHPNFSEWLDVVLRHIAYQEEFFGNTPLAAILMRKHLLWYTKGFPESKALRESLNRVETLNEAKENLQTFAARIGKDCVRHACTNAKQERYDYDPKYEMDRVHDRGVDDIV